MLQCGGMPDKPETYLHRLRAKHRPAVNERRGVDAYGHKVYGRRWEKVSKLRLNREPLCRSCGKLGLVVAATDADHIIPLSQGGAKYDLDNTQSLCHSCHSRKTATETRVK